MDYFNKNFSWNGYYGQFVSENTNAIINEKTGNSAELNYVFHLILEEMGISTELLLVSTRNNGKIISSYPYLGQFDGMLNLVKLGEARIIIDASTINSKNMLHYPLRYNNRFGLILNESADFVNILIPLSQYTFKQEFRWNEVNYDLINHAKWNGYFQNPDEKDDYWKPLLAVDLNFQADKKETPKYKEDYYHN